MNSDIKSKLLKIAFLVVTFLVFQEIAVRLVFPVPELSNFDRSMYVDKNEQGGFVRNRSFLWFSKQDFAASSFSPVILTLPLLFWPGKLYKNMLVKF